VREQEDLFELGQTALLIGGEQPGDGRGLRRFVIVDERVEQLHGGRILRYLDLHLDDHEVLVLRAEEQAKTMDAVFQITERLDSFGVDRRREPIVGIGGGVLLDVVGLAASLYRRGTPYVRVPTTLMALIDAGIGVKTGVNFHDHKNRLGTYFAPKATFLDRAFLRTLDDRHIRNGLAEIVKMAIVSDAELFGLLEEAGRSLVENKLQGSGTPVTVLRRAIHSMLVELEPNLWEKELNRRVDFGHSFSPTLEMRALPELLHGEAVAVDMAISTVLARRRRLIEESERDRVLRLMLALGLPIFHPLCTTQFLQEALRDTVRHRDGLQRLPLPVSIGNVEFFNDVAVEELDATVDELKLLARSM
jgi:3-dehydroquinate synthase